MIKEAEKKKIVAVLGYRYVAPVQDMLSELKIVNARGEEHSRSMIINVMNGYPHEDIEHAIYMALKRKKEIIKARKSLLK
ncbi:hypothetical protein HCG49_16900 [Arenibacter sp. 6A1]|uniref:hypothetical protein n=1 Tax=Arenibacter sp. 6A1 TaxID=2720391 RepID=UPI001445DFB2|nr:hypothetical protein [Arenibacter sp. 6A1]NKI28234.1 hypothetical protein [Arenibacter sp. 6A1]